MTKKIQVSFRLTTEQLAHALEIIQALEPSYHPVSLSSMSKLVFQDYLAKMSIVSNPWPSERAIEEIKQIRQRSGQKIPEDRLDDNDELTKIIERHSQQEARPQEERKVLIKKETEKETKSEKNVVTDFRPPTMEELTSEEE